jgi:hypothetical protein
VAASNFEIVIRRHVSLHDAEHDPGFDGSNEDGAEFRGEAGSRVRFLLAARCDLCREPRLLPGLEAVARLNGRLPAWGESPERNLSEC